MGVNVSAAFAKNDELYNGLNSIEKELLDEPQVMRTAVIRYTVKFAKEDFEHGGARTPTVKIQHIEPLAGDAAEAAMELAKAAYKGRTGGDIQPDLFDQDDEDQAEEAPAPASTGKRSR